MAILLPIVCTYSAFVIGAQPACLANRFNRLICTKWCHTRPVKCCRPFASFVLQTYCPQHCCRPIVCRRQAIFRAIHRGPIGPAGSTCVRVPSTKIWTLKLVIACIRIQIEFSPGHVMIKTFLPIGCRLTTASFVVHCGAYPWSLLMTSCFLGPHISICRARADSSSNYFGVRNNFNWTNNRYGIEIVYQSLWQFFVNSFTAELILNQYPGPIGLTA